MIIDLKDYFKKLSLASFFIFSLIFWLCVNSLYSFGTNLIGGRNLQTLISGNEKHKAVLLKKYNLTDINLIVKVDGQKVYISPDYATFPDKLYRETLVWDETSRVVVLELMGKRVFAYDAEEKRELKKSEIMNYKLSPISSDRNYAPIKDIEEE